MKQIAKQNPTFCLSHKPFPLTILPSGSPKPGGEGKRLSREIKDGGNLFFSPALSSADDPRSSPQHLQGKALSWTMV